MVRNFLLFIYPALFFASCDEAPILSQAAVFNDGKKAIIITLENIVTITSKKSGGGATYKSGYTTCYLNAIDPNTGETLKRKKLGDFKDRIDFLGQCGGKLWCFSYDPDVSIHARDPKTLEVTITAKDILAKNAGMAAGFTEQGYQFNLDSSVTKVFVTTKDGYSYVVDPYTLIAIRADDKANKRYYGGDDVTESSNVALNDSVELNWKADTRKTLSIHREYFDVESYKFFSHAGSTPHKSLYYKTKERKEYPEISFIEPRFLLDKMAKRKGQNEDILLTQNNTVFIISKSILGNTFNWIVSAIHVSDIDVKLLWQKEISGTEKINYSDKDILFSSMLPGKLLVVFENIIVCFDINNGTEVWRKNIS